MSKTFTLFSDPAHGWLRVTVADCNAIGLAVESFSSYSYCDAAYLYLEEDCDASKFFEAYKAKHGAMPAIIDSCRNSESPIRRKARIKAPDPAAWLASL